MNFYAPLAFLFFMAIPVVILMYILKPRSQDYVVSSLYLWNEALKDIQAGAPWQKLRRNILLLLQLLVLSFAIFALARPFAQIPGSSAQEVIVVLDTSASMQSVDVKPSRFEAARREIGRYIDNMRPGTTMTIVSAGSSTRIVENMTGDKGMLHGKLNGIKVTNGLLNAGEMIEIVKVLMRQYDRSEVIFYTDSPIEDFTGDRITWVKLGADSHNYAVTLLSHSVNKGRISGLSRIVNFGGEKARLSVSLYADDRIIDARDVEVEGGASENVYWYEIPEKTRVLKCVIENEDILAVDNTAWDVVNTDNENKVLLVTSKNIFLERALSVLPGIELFKTTPEGAANQSGYGLYVFDGHLPPVIPADGNILVFNPPEGWNLFEVGGEWEVGGVSWSGGMGQSGNASRSGSPLLSHIKKLDFSISTSKRLVLPSWGETALESRGQPLMIHGEKGTQRVVAAGFDLHNTDLPLKTSYPVLMNNIVSWLLPRQVKNIEAVLPGDPVEFNLIPGVKSARVMTPGGETAVIAPPFPAASFENTGEPGVYILEQTLDRNAGQERPDAGRTGDKAGAGGSNIGSQDSRVHYFAVNVPAGQESNPAGSLKSGDAGTQSGINMDRPETGKNLRWIFMFAAFIIVLIEWWVWSNGV